jgi:hypothetical protein
MGTNNRVPEQRERIRRANEERDRTRAAIERIERWNAAVADPLPCPTFGDALRSERYWLRVFCPGCNTGNSVDLRRLDRHPNASVESLILSLKCSWCRDRAPSPKLLGLFCEPAARHRDAAG